MVKYYTPPGLSDIPYPVRPFTRGPYAHYVQPADIFRDTSYKDNVMDYNDPFEVNSLADALFNRAALEKLFPTAGTARRLQGRESLIDIPEGVWQNLQGLWYTLNKGIIRPLSDTDEKGKWAPDFRAAGLNLLTNFSESMDVLANPIKGLLLEKEGRNFLGYSGKGFMRGLGADLSTGRKNYDWDTGSFVLNIVGEILSDPFNWMTIGGKAVIQSIVNSGADALAEAAQVAAKKAGKELSEEGAQRLARVTMKTLQNMPDAIRTAGHAAVQKVSTKGWVRPAVDAANDIAFSRAFIQEMSNLGADRLGMTAIRNVQNLVNASEGLEKVFLHGSTFGMLKGAGWAFKRGALNPILGYIDTHLRKATRTFVRADGTIPLHKMEDALQNIEDSLRYKAADSGQVAEYVEEQIKLMQIFSIEKDIQGVVEAIQKTSLPKTKMTQLDSYFLKATDNTLDFKGYLDLLDGLAKKYPHLEAKYISLKAIFDQVDSALKIDSARDLDKLFSTTRRDMASIVKELKAVLKDAGNASMYLPARLRRTVLDLKADLQRIPEYVENADRLMTDLDETLDTLEAFQVSVPKRLSEMQEYVDRLHIGVQTDVASIWKAKVPANATARQLENIAEYEARYAAINWSSFIDRASPENFELNKILSGIRKYPPSDPVVRKAFPVLFPAKGSPTNVRSVLDDAMRKMKEVAAVRRRPVALDRKTLGALNQVLAKLDYAEETLGKTQTSMTKKLSEQLTRQTKFAQGGADAITELQEAIFKNPGVSLDTLIEQMDVNHAQALTFPKVTRKVIRDTLDLLDNRVLTLLQDMGRAAERIVYTDWYVDNLEDIYKRLQDTLDSEDKIFAGGVLQELQQALEGIYEAFNDIGVEKNFTIFMENQPVMVRTLDNLHNTQRLLDNEINKALEQIKSTDITALTKDQVYGIVGTMQAEITARGRQLAATIRELQTIDPIDPKEVYRVNDLVLKRDFLQQDLLEYRKLLQDLQAAESPAAMDALLTARIKELTPVDVTDSFEELLSGVQEVMESLSVLDLDIATKSLTDYVDDAIRYQLKLSQANTALILLNDPQLIAFTDDILSFGKIGQTLQELSSNTDYGDLAQNIQSFAYEYVTYGNLLKDIMGDQVLGPLKFNLFDTLQNYKQFDLQHFAAYKEYYISKVLDKMQSQLTSLQMRKRFALDWTFGDGLDKQGRRLRPEGPYYKPFQDWLDTRGFEKGRAHTAATDSLRVQFLIEQDPAFAEFRRGMDLENKLYIVMDTETTGTEIGRDRLLQIGWHDYTNPTAQTTLDIEALPNMYPSEDVIDKVYGGIEEFRRAHVNPLLPTEYEAITSFFTSLRQMEEATGKSVVLIAHNGEAFDFPMIAARINSARGTVDYSIYKYFNNMDKVDSLVLLHKANGVTYLTAEQRKAVRRYLSTYIESKTSNPYKHPTEQKFIRTADGSLAKDLEELADTLDEMEKGSPDLTEVSMGLAMELRQTSRNIWDNMRNIGLINSALRNAQLTYDQATGVILGTNGKPLQMAGGLLHPMQMFATDAGQLMPGAIRTHWSTAKNVKRFFRNVGEMGKVFSDKDKLQLFHFSRATANISDKLKRLDLAALHYDRYAQFTKALHAEMTKWYGKTILIPPKYFTLFEHTLVGTADRYAMANKLYAMARDLAQKQGFDKQLTEFVRRMSQNEDMNDAIKTLRRREIMMQYDAGVRPAQEVFDTGPFDLNATELYRNNESFRADVAYKARELGELQEPLSMIKNKHGADYAITQMQFAVIEGFRKNWDVLQKYIERNPDMIPHLQTNMIEWGNRSALAELDWIAQMNTDDLKEYLWFTEGRLTFGTPYKVSAEYATYMDRIYKSFTDRQEELAKSGILVHYKPNSGRMYIHLRNDPEYVRRMIDADLEWKRWNYNNPTLEQKDPYRRFYIDHEPAVRTGLDMNQAVFNAMEETKQTLNDLTHGKVQGTLGDMLYVSALEDIDEAFPPEIRKQLIPISAFKDAAHFDSTIVFNRTNIGLIGSRREIMPKISSIPFKNYMNAGQQLVPILDGRIKAKYLFFDEVNLLSGPLYKELTNDELFSMLQRNPQLRLAALVQDSKLGAKVQQFHAASAAQIGILRNSYEDMALLPSGTLLQAFKHINTYQITNGVAKFLKKYVVIPTKIGYLTSLGFLFRNIIDSTLKNIALTNDPTDAPKMLRHMYETGRHFRTYTEIYKEMIKYTDDVIKKESQFFSLRTLDRMYEVNPNRGISKEMFQMIHNFLEHGPSAGLTTAQLQTMIAKNKHYKELLKIPEEFDLMHELLEGKYAKYTPWKVILDKNSSFEQIVRLSAYTWELMNGSTIDDAMDKILRTHFDYSMKPKWMMYMEYVVPFASFFVNNTAYWMEVLDAQPWIAGFAADIYRPIWDRDEYSHREINENRSLQYNILAGNIIFDNNLTLKLNPSMLDAVRALIDPSESYNRVIPYVRIPVDMIWKAATGQELQYNIPKLVATNLPMIGPAIQKVWKAPEEEPWDYGTIQTIYDRTGMRLPSYMPSIFGAVQRQYYFAYPSTDMVYMTKSKEKYEGHLKKGAIPVDGVFQAAVELYLQRVYSPKPRKYYSRRYYAPKKRKPAYQKKPRKLYVSKAFAKTYYPPHMDLYAGARVLASVRNTQFRMPSSNRIMMSVKPALIRRLYTGSGQARFKSRLVPVTAKNLASKLKAGWSNLR